MSSIARNGERVVVVSTSATFAGEFGTVSEAGRNGAWIKLDRQPVGADVYMFLRDYAVFRQVPSFGFARYSSDDAVVFVADDRDVSPEVKRWDNSGCRFCRTLAAHSERRCDMSEKSSEVRP